MREGDPNANEETIEQSQTIIGQLLGYSSQEDAIAFLHQHANELNHTVIEQLKQQVAHDIRVDVDRALAIARLTQAAAALAGDPLSEALSCHALGMALDCSGKYVQALDLYNQAQAVYRSLGDEVEAARMARSKLPVLMYLGRYDEALHVANEARAVLERHGQSALVAQVDINVGTIYERLAQYHTALIYHQRAAEVFEQLDDRRSLALAHANMAIVYFYLNDFERSLALYEQARRIYQDLGLHLWAVQIDYNVACLFLRRGRFDHALKQLQWVETEARNHGDTTQAALCILDLAEAYLQLNALEDALEASQAAARQFTDLQMTYELARANMHHGMARLHSGMLDQATSLLQEARTLFTREGNEIYQALCDLYLSEVALKQDRYAEALRLCQTARQIFESNQLDRKAAYATFQLAKIHFQADDMHAARSLSDLTWQKYQGLDIPWLNYQWSHLQGNLAERLGDENQAYESYRHALDHLEGMRSTIRVDEFKATFVRDKLRLYEDLIKLCLKHGSWEKKQEAFSLVEAAKSRALVDLLARSLEMKHSRSSIADRPMAERWNRLREELDWYYNKFNEHEAKGARRPVGLGQELQENIRQREAELTKLLRQLQSQDPEYFSLQGVAHVTSVDIAREMAENETLLEYYRVGEEIGVFIVDASGLRLAEPLSAAGPIRDRLRKLRFQLNKHLLDAGYVRKHERALRQLTDEHLMALYEALIEPIARSLEGQRLVIVPHDFLHYIPFHALHDGQSYLIDRFEISYCPSAQVFRLCQQRRSNRREGLTPALIVGVPDERLPQIDQEVENLRSIIRGAEVLVGDAASLEQFQRLAERCRILHLATHATFRQDNPLFSALKLSHSWLNFYDLFQLDLQAELVTLSACQTGVNQISAGDELIGLMRGFLYAGAPSLLLSLWAVNDRSTAAFMEVFYAQLQAGDSARTALRQAQRAIRESYPHPYHWAPFVLMGRP